MLLSLPMMSGGEAHAQSEQNAPDGDSGNGDNSDGDKATNTDAANSTVISNDLNPENIEGRLTYLPAQFARFAPQNALDMVQQIPGFSISDNDDDSRGLGEASQNVIINGKRISGKSNNAETVLSRTPTSNVVRIEIIDGASLDIAGLTGQVLNLVTSNTGISGSYRWRPMIRTRGIDHHWYSAEVSVAGPLAKGEFSLALRNSDRSFRGGVVGGDTSIDADGNFLNSRSRFGTFAVDTPKLTANYNSSSGDGDIFNINGELAFNRFRGTNDWIRTEANGDVIIQTGRNRNNRPSFEISSDYEFGLAGGRLKLIGLQKMERARFTNFFRSDPQNGDEAEGSRFSREDISSETVGRAEYRWKSGQSDWQLSAEGAYNSFTADPITAELVNGIFVDTVEDRSKVSEKRGEAILSYGRPLSDTLSLQSSIGGEYSILAVAGNKRNFLRPKGSVSFSWNASKNLDISTRFSREVGQLQFSDFLASIDVQNTNNNAGNVNLVPPQSWLTEIEFNRSLGSAGSIKLQLEGELISDIVDQIAIDDTTESIGNLPSAKRASIELTSSFLLDNIGWKGAKLDVSAYYQWSSVFDELTQRNRRISRQRVSTVEIELRHDIPNSDWAWGARYEDRKRGSFVRLDFISRERENDPRTRIFLEHKDLLGLKFRVAAEQISGGGFLDRQIFYEDRRDGDIDFIRDRYGESGVRFRFDISGTF